tara:strand:- start:96 stop:398 length:303 start_codon:yes stop_codon:yes gene_type:complete
MMNDLDICKRIAKIEGYKVNLSIKCEGVWCSRYDNNCYGIYNPLTDDELCFRLMIKYELSLIAHEGDQTNWDCVISDILICDKNPNKAICLAIIEANKGK